ncbi:hypothetical protein [Pseudoalteromonas sp. R3]|uniref:hypothetical protein n=1 Tax=Pseudoalteromonas sp. R3 TaxID=1709477 RepID=UPI000A561CCB|nr:hypothetical protein [Pseudoalteromonas sp. R3]AZZ96622.1 hypothetical protein ELR70_05265 [Pseudoalteromonas sp. R3]
MRRRLLLLLLFVFSAVVRSAEFENTGPHGFHEDIVSITMNAQDGAAYTVRKNTHHTLASIQVETQDQFLSIKNACFKKIFFPALQSMKVSREYNEQSQKHDLVLVSVNFGYFGDTADALSDDTKLEDWQLRLTIHKTHTNIALIQDKTKVFDYCR